MPRKNSGSPGVVFAQACCRVDLAGGTLDLWPLYLFHENSVTVNFGVNVRTSCRITPRADSRLSLLSRDTERAEEFADLDALCAAKKYRHSLAAHLLRFFQPDGGLTIETHSESPAGAGISGSSALMIACTAALARYTGRRLSHEEIRVIAQNVEAQVINVPTGCQDYYPALYGGVNAIHLRADGIHREAIDVAPEEIEKRFVLAYTGAPRQSGINNWEVFKAHIDGKPKVLRNLERISEVAQAMRRALERADWKETGKLMREEWDFRKRNLPTISTKTVDRIIDGARRNGALSGKVCGAGGGGCVVLLIEPDARQRVEEAVAKAGGQLLQMRIDRSGVQVNVT